MGVAAAAWLAALLFLVQDGGTPAQTVVGAAALLVFFAIACLYYARAAIFVDGAGLVVRSLVRTRRYSFREIRRVVVLPGPVTVYAVTAGRRPFLFTSFFKHHRALADLMVDRAGLSPGRG